MEAQPLVNEITKFVNSFSLKSDEFINEMSNEHRTLQQSFTRLCLKWLEYCASDDYRYDQRNEATHHVNKHLVDTYKDAVGNLPSNSLPMI